MYLLKNELQESAIKDPLTKLYNRRYMIAERIRKVIESYKFEGISWPLTVSIGLSEIISTDNELTFLERADKNLYRAKESGRNKVV
jgi:GGDEF domain-containing protein